MIMMIMVLVFTPTNCCEFFRGGIQIRPLLIGEHFQVRIVKASIDTGNETIFISQERENMFQYIQILIEWKG